MKKFNLEEEHNRLYEMTLYERQYAPLVCCGIDEAGRGPLCGEVCVACVVLDPNKEILFLNDSKKLTEKKREELYIEIKNKAISYGIAFASVEEIDKINILQATYLAATRAFNECEKNTKIDILLTDALNIPQLKERKQVPIIKGDAKSISIAAASILAKVTRDHLLLEYDKKYPEYGFAKHKGYGTAFHIEQLKKYGPCPIHRRSFIKNFL